MNCPNCKATLVTTSTTDTDHTPLQKCPSCDGVWLSREALEGAHAGVWGNLESMGVDTVEFFGDYICPHCSVSLTAVCPHDHRELRIDRCASCHGVWLDHGELGKLSRILSEFENQNSSPSERPVDWSAMKWAMYRLYASWKASYMG